MKIFCGPTGRRVSKGTRFKGGEILRFFPPFEFSVLEKENRSKRCRRMKFVNHFFTVIYRESFWNLEDLKFSKGLNLYSFTVSFFLNFEFSRILNSSQFSKFWIFKVPISTETQIFKGNIQMEFFRNSFKFDHHENCTKLYKEFVFKAIIYRGLLIQSCSTFGISFQRGNSV